MPTPREKFQALLKKLFQFDCAELDFGIYRIMNQKRSVVERFIEKDLLAGVAAELSSGALAEQSGLAQQLEDVKAQIVENFGDEALDAEGNLAAQWHKAPRGKQYLELRERVGKAKSRPQLESEIFNHLYTFFSRYYDEGDFMSLRRYSKRDKYAIPYNGEEVHLHWANADQYYIKTGENFTDYSYRHGGWSVHFKLRNADVEQNNVKGAKRFFVPRAADVAVDAAKHTLTIPFEYRPLTPDEDARFTGNGLQEKILKEASPGIVEAAKAEANALAALVHEKRKDADGDPVSLLDHHLRTYARKNSSDFFIHKDLRGFLERELDFYLKNEVLNLDELEAGGEARAESWFQMLRAIKGIGRKIIAFVAQLEDFQKRIFEKKKFVTEVHYCVTLDRVPAALYPEIIKNKAQIEEWKRLFYIQEIERDTTQPGYSEPLKLDFLKAHQSLVIDTSFFPAATHPEFTPGLLESKEFLGKAASHDDALDGVIVASENLHALRLLGERYQNSVKCTYIDPPYNTGDGDFIYKDSFQHSSWLTLASERITAGKRFLTKDGFLVVSIDDVELHRLLELLRLTFGENHVATLVWDRNRKNDAKLFSVGHEYMVVVARDAELLKERGVELREPREGLDDAKKLITRLKKEHGKDWEAIRKSWLAWFEQILVSDPRRRMMRYSKVGPRGPYRDDGNISWPGGGGPRYEILHPKTKKPVKIPSRGWMYGAAERFWEEYEKGVIIFGDDETTIPGIASYLFESDGQVMPTVFYSYAQTSSQEFKALMGEVEFNNPKNWRDIARITRYLAGKDDVILDYFGGSGTTGHAVIVQNREDGGRRKYVLVEMGAHFDTVLKPRLQKVIYSKDWKDGKPVSRQGSSHAFKYLRLESYEDALDSIAFQAAEGDAEQSMLALEDYVLSYMLDFETRESETLLNVAKLDTPFDYTLRRHGKDEPQPVDLPETFNYLIGLHVESRRVLQNKSTRYLVYRGRVAGRTTVILWRTTKGWTEKEFETDRAFIAKEKLTEGAEDIFVNTDSFIEGAQSLDPVFKNLMFNAE